MRLKPILSALVLLLIIVSFGCVGSEYEVIYSNPNYPYFNITNVSTDRPENPSVNHYTINVTITSSAPEKTIKYENGSIINTGRSCTQVVTVSLLNRSYTENVTMAYNETKMVFFDLGTLTPGNNTVVISTPSMNTTCIAKMWDWRI